MLVKKLQVMNFLSFLRFLQSYIKKREDGPQPPVIQKDFILLIIDLFQARMVSLFDP